MPYKEGWGVHVLAVWEDLDTGERISDIEVSVVRLGPTNEYIIGGVLCARDGNMFVPFSCFEEHEDNTYGDTHDLRSHWFASYREAREHADYTLKRWQNPAPWESFVQI